MRAGERKCIALPRITARLILAKDPTTIPSRNLGFSRNGGSSCPGSPICLWPGCSCLYLRLFLCTSQVCDRFLTGFFFFETAKSCNVFSHKPNLCLSQGFLKHGKVLC